jgi:hypothetical protein
MDTIGLDDMPATQSDAIKYRSYVYSVLFCSKRKSKAEGYVAVSCCPSTKQKATSKHGKVPTKQDQRLDHATKLEASLTRQRRLDADIGFKLKRRLK